MDWPAEYSLSLGIPFADSPVRVGRDHGVECSVDDQTGAGFAFMQRGFDFRSFDKQPDLASNGSQRPQEIPILGLSSFAVELHHAKDVRPQPYRECTGRAQRSCRYSGPPLTFGIVCNILHPQGLTTFPAPPWETLPRTVRSLPTGSQNIFRHWHVNGPIVHTRNGSLILPYDPEEADLPVEIHRNGLEQLRDGLFDRRSFGEHFRHRVLNGLPTFGTFVIRHISDNCEDRLQGTVIGQKRGEYTVYPADLSR